MNSFTNLDQIKQGINQWTLIRHNSTVLKSHFQPITYFSSTYTPPVGAPDQELYLHVYPAITTENKLKFYLISSKFDTKEVYEEDPAAFASYIHEAPARYIFDVNPDSNSDHGITEHEALHRIENWENHYQEWIDAKAPVAQGGLFQALAIPSSFTTVLPIGGVYNYLFALKNNNDPSTVYFAADLIVHNRGDAFYDTVRPVPPFGNAVGLREEDFFLLELSLELV